MTPTPLRPGPSGMSGSCCGEGGFGLVRLDGGDDGLDGDPAVGDQLTAGAAHRRGKRRGPQVLVHEDGGDAPGLHRGGEVLDVLLGERLRELCLETGKLAQTLAEEDVAHLAAAMDPGSVAGVLVYENLWAAPFASAMRRAGGQLIANGRIPVQALIAAVEADQAEAALEPAGV